MKAVVFFKNKITISILIVILYFNNAFSYEVINHSEFSIESAQRSILHSSDNILNDIDIDYISYKMSIDNTDNKYDISQVIGFGAEFEDSTDKRYRPLNHFYDPVNDKALGGNWLALKRGRRHFPENHRQLHVIQTG